MGQTTEELRAQIADQREDLGRDLEAIGDRISPARMAERRKAAVVERWQSTRDRVMGTAGDAREAAGSVPRSALDTVEGNPLAVGLVAFGAGLVLATLLPETRPEQRLADKVQPTVEHAASELGAAAQDTVEHLKPKAQEAVEQVKSSAQESVEQVKDHATS